MSTQNRSVLLVTGDVDNPWSPSFKAALERVGLIYTMHNSDMLLQLRRFQFDIVMLDETRVINDSALIGHILSIQPTTRVIVVSNSPDWKRARQCFQYGAVDYIAATVSPQDLAQAIQEA